MARRLCSNGNLYIDTLNDLKRGDKVCVATEFGKFVNTTVTRVKRVECAVIINVKKVAGINCCKYVGYYTDNIAVCGRGRYFRRLVLSINCHYANDIEEALEEAEKRSGIIVNRAKALSALQTLKNWFFDKDQEWADKIEIE